MPAILGRFPGGSLGCVSGSIKYNYLRIEIGKTDPILSWAGWDPMSTHQIV